MNDPSVTDHFAAIAAELRRAADGIETLVGSGLRKPYFNLNIQPGTPGDGDSTAASVDAMGLALLGKRGRAAKMHDGTYHYNVEDTQRGPISLSIYQSVPIEWALKREAAAALAEREAELERLRAEVAVLRAAAALQPDAEHYETSGWTGGDSGSGVACACGVEFDGFDSLKAAGEQLARHIADPSGLGYSREADDPTPVSPARVPLHTGSMTEDGLVDETPETGERVEGAERVAAKRQALQWRRAVTSHAGLTVSQAEQVVRNKAHAEALDEDNERAKREVERYMTTQDAGRIANPNLARFLAEREDRRRYQRHFLGLEESAKHGDAIPPVSAE